ncbi:MAG: hypothetical protein NTY08_07185 [Proteobacteria bacterium]|nr:hypothetical protein [Pseudomonadota bacterium]
MTTPILVHSAIKEMAMLLRMIRNQCSQNRTIALIFCILTSSHIANASAPSSESSEPLDYATMTHEITIEMLRAGTESGAKQNEFQFIVTGYGLINSPEEKSLDLAKRKKVTIELGRFGETKMDALTIWRADDKARDFKQFHVDGKAIRDLVAKSMNELKIPEREVIIQTDVSLIAKKKKYFLLPDEQIVATISYLPLSDATAAEQQKSFILTDDKGAYVKLSVRYKKEPNKKDQKTTNNSK